MDEVHKVTLCFRLTCINLVQDTSEKSWYFDIFDDLIVLLFFHVYILYYRLMLDLSMQWKL